MRRLWPANRSSRKGCQTRRQLWRSIAGDVANMAIVTGSGLGPSVDHYESDRRDFILKYAGFGTTFPATTGNTIATLSQTTLSTVKSDSHHMTPCVFWSLGFPPSSLPVHLVIPACVKPHHPVESLLLCLIHPLLPHVLVHPHLFVFVWGCGRSPLP